MAITLKSQKWWTSRQLGSEARDVVEADVVFWPILLQKSVGSTLSAEAEI
jgi:hypothetical protein